MHLLVTVLFVILAAITWGPLLISRHRNIATAAPVNNYDNATHHINGRGTGHGAHERVRRANDLGDLTAGTSGILNEDHVAVCSCKELKDDGFTTSGIYIINPDGLGDFLVYCDMSVVGGEGWTVIQRRIDGAEDFDKNWKQYKTGFGDFNGNFWLGLEKIHRLTESGSFELYIAVKYHDTEQSGAVKWAKYDSFSIANEANDYKLTVGSYDGTSTAGDALDTVSNEHDGQKFSTKDVDNDSHATNDCADTYKSGWWFKACLKANLNGVWYSSGNQGNQGITWDTAEDDYSFRQAVMAIKEA